MKLTRSQFLVAAIPMLVGASAGSAGAARRRLRKIVVTGNVTKAKSDTGIIEIVRSGHLRLKAVIATDENTRFIRPDKTEGSFEDLVEGAKIQARGRLNQDASIQATRVLIIRLPNPKQ